MRKEKCRDPCLDQIDSLRLAKWHVHASGVKGGGVAWKAAKKLAATTLRRSTLRPSYIWHPINKTELSCNVPSFLLKPWIRHRLDGKTEYQNSSDQEQSTANADWIIGWYSCLAWDCASCYSADVPDHWAESFTVARIVDGKDSSV